MYSIVITCYFYFDSLLIIEYYIDVYKKNCAVVHGGHGGIKYN